jgi:hypothetical protein
LRIAAARAAAIPSAGGASAPTLFAAG